MDIMSNFILNILKATTLFFKAIKKILGLFMNLWMMWWKLNNLKNLIFILQYMVYHKKITDILSNKRKDSL